MRPILLALLAAPALANDANLITLTDYVAPFGARALDGTPYEFWFAPSTAPAGSIEARSFVIDIMGGAWCTSIAACADRAYNPSKCVFFPPPFLLFAARRPSPAPPPPPYRWTRPCQLLPGQLQRVLLQRGQGALPQQDGLDAL